MSVVLSQRRTGNAVDVFWRGSAAAPTSLSYRLVDAEPDTLLCLRPSENPTLLADDAAVAQGDASELVILRLAELPRALPGLLPQRDRRNAFIAALRDSLEDWPVQGHAAPAARLRAACAEAIARLPDAAARQPSRRRSAKPQSATKADEESQEALFRALYFCRQRADGDA